MIVLLNIKIISRYSVYNWQLQIIADVTKFFFLICAQVCHGLWARATCFHSCLILFLPSVSNWNLQSKSVQICQIVSVPITVPQWLPVFLSVKAGVLTMAQKALQYLPHGALLRPPAAPQTCQVFPPQGLHTGFPFSPNVPSSDVYMASSLTFFPARPS